MTQNLYQRGQRFFGLDPRGVTIVQTERNTFVWVGAQVLPACREPYLQAAREHVANLAKYERANGNFVTVEQGAEKEAFWEAFGFDERPA